jgi:1,4-alpha-glucan branching enzyme
MAVKWLVGSSASWQPCPIRSEIDNSMPITAAPDQIDRIVNNHHQNPFEVLGPHQVEKEGQSIWVVRTYQPNASAVWVVLPEERQEYPMETQHHPHFFECIISSAQLSNYQLKLKATTSG